MPNKLHSKIALEIGVLIRGWTRENGGEAGVEARTKAGELPNYRLPDISFWKPGYEGGDDDPPTLAMEYVPRRRRSRSSAPSADYFGERRGGLLSIDRSHVSAKLFEGERDGEHVAAMGRSRLRACRLRTSACGVVRGLEADSISAAACQPSSAGTPKMSLIASFRLSRASSSVRSCEFAPGTSSLQPIHHPSSQMNVAENSRAMFQV